MRDGRILAGLIIGVIVAGVAGLAVLVTSARTDWQPAEMSEADAMRLWQEVRSGEGAPHLRALGDALVDCAESDSPDLAPLRRGLS